MPPTFGSWRPSASTCDRPPPWDLDEQAGEFAQVLATVLPELALRMRDLPANYRLPPDQARRRPFESVWTMLAGIASSAPVVLVLDDLPWADTASLDLLCHVARRQSALRLMVLGAFGEGDAERSPAFARALDDLNRPRVLRSAAVGPLPEDEMAQPLCVLPVRSAQDGGRVRRRGVEGGGVVHVLLQGPAGQRCRRLPGLPPSHRPDVVRGHRRQSWHYAPFAPPQ
jgi:AAA ATPase-like protein